MDLLTNIVVNLALPLLISTTPVENAVTTSATFVAQNLREIGGQKSCKQLQQEQDALINRIKRQYKLPNTVNPYTPPLVDPVMTEEDVAAYKIERPATRVVEIEKELNKRCTL